ncbi:MAG: transcription termination/antitermination factor NusG [Bacteroidales bacterium]|nr:transcription termination/antitermination factor NusG [Bacteroidales bacterium]
MEQQETKWYVVRAISGKEKKAKENIEKVIAERGWTVDVPTVLIPTEQIVAIRSGKKVVKDRNYFPGYVIVEARMRDEIEAVIQNTPNVIDFLRERAGKPTAMRPTEIKRILGEMDAQVDGIDVMNRFIVGEAVKVIDGPFNSFSGIVDEVNEEKKKLKVTVKIFGRKTPLELGFAQVEKEQ